MKKNYALLILFICCSFIYGQDADMAIGVIVNAANDKPLESVNIVNLNQVIGTTTNNEGKFEIQAKLNDTIHLSYLGFKSIKVRVTNDWLKFGSSKIELTELALALEEVIVSNVKLTGFLEIDVKRVPVNNTSRRYNIPGLPNAGYESSSKAQAINRILGAVFNPADFLHRTFSKRNVELRKLKKMKKNDEIRNILASRFDREMLTALLNVNRVDLDEMISQCNYSKGFIKTANDLQILDAISECYEEYKLVSRGRKKRI